MNRGITLTKENFWNRMMEQYPNATTKFCQWIDAYKVAVGWKELFGEKVKFHDLPYAMQNSIWREYEYSLSDDSFKLSSELSHLGSEIETLFNKMEKGKLFQQ